jgi:hypothetical protein
MVGRDFLWSGDSLVLLRGVNDDDDDEDDDDEAGVDARLRAGDGNGWAGAWNCMFLEL